MVIGMYDKEADAAYIYMKTISASEVKDTIELNQNIILDLDSKKRLIGIEILAASKVVPKAVVSAMQTA